MGCLYWWHLLANCCGNYQLGTLVKYDFKLELVNIFMDVDHELGLNNQLSALKQQKSVS